MAGIEYRVFREPGRNDRLAPIGAGLAARVAGAGGAALLYANNTFNASSNGTGTVQTKMWFPVGGYFMVCYQQADGGFVPLGFINVVGPKSLAPNPVCRVGINTPMVVAVLL